MTEAPAPAPAIKPRGSLTRRLIWLAAIWSVVALILAGGLLTTAFRDTALRRLDGVIEMSDREVVAVTRVVNGQVTDFADRTPFSGILLLRRFLKPGQRRYDLFFLRPVLSSPRHSYSTITPAAMDEKLKQQLFPAVAVFNLTVGIYLIARMLMGRFDWSTFWTQALIGAGIGIVTGGITFALMLFSKR